MQAQTLLIAIPLEENLLKPLYQWGKKFNFTNVENIHLIYVVKKNITPLEFGLMESPDEKTFQDMIPPLERFLQEEAKKIIPTEFNGKTILEVTSDFHPEELVVDYIKKNNVNLIVVSTRGKHGIDGLFHSSFTDYMVKFSPCDIFVVRPS